MKLGSGGRGDEGRNGRREMRVGSGGRGDEGGEWEDGR